MTRICIVSPYAYYFFSGGKKGRVGGAELDLFLVGKHLSLLDDVQVSFVVADFGQKKVEEYGKIKIFRSMLLKPNFWRFISEPIKFVVALGKADADIYVCATAGPEVGIISFFCKMFGRKFIYRTAHNMDCNKDYVNKHTFLGKIYEFGLLNADVIFTSVGDHEGILRKNYGDKIKNLTFVPYGLEMSENADGKGREFVLWVARGEKWKNPHFFLDLVESFPAEKFVMIIPKKMEEAEFFEEVKTRAAGYSNLTFIDGVPFEKIQPYFDKAKVFINTSDYEGFTFTLLQSGIAGTPIVYYNVNPDGIIQKYELGYWCDSSVDKMKENLHKLISNEEDWNQKSANIRRYINESHNIEKNVLIWRDNFKKL
jgi:glycosyltransferase involved in cell wall biosynthesis